MSDVWLNQKKIYLSTNKLKFVIWWQSKKKVRCVVASWRIFIFNKHIDSDIRVHHYLSFLCLISVFVSSCLPRPQTPRFEINMRKTFGWDTEKNWHQLKWWHYNLPLFIEHLNNLLILLFIYISLKWKKKDFSSLL